MTDISIDDVPAKVYTGKKNIPDKLHPICERCIRQCREKYDGFMGSEGTYYQNGFAVGCKFIPEDGNYLDQRLKSHLTEEEWEVLNSWRSPLLWAERNLIDPDSGLPWKPWPHQIPPLLCTSPRITLRYGRRNGKCQAYGTDVTLSDGSVHKIEDLIGQEIEVNSLDLNSLECVKAKAFVDDNGEEECVLIRTKYGDELIRTLNHPLLSSDGWVSVEDGTLKAGVKIMAPVKSPNVGAETFDKNLLQQIACSLGTESDSRSIPSFVYSLDEEHIALFLKALSGENKAGYCFASKDLAKGVRRLLTRLGTVSAFRNEDDKRFYVDVLDNNEVYKLAGLYWDEVVEIRPLGKLQTAGLYVPEYHNYVNDVIEHNTISLAVLILWYLFTSGGMRDPQTGKVRNNLMILAVTPQKAHIDNLFQRVRRFMSLSPHLENCIERSVRGSPQLIALRGDGKETGNQIVGFASGDSSGNKGLGVRGQDADVIIVDEGAYVSEDVLLEVVNPILLTKPTTKMIMSSTPSGTAGDYFEQLCAQSPNYKEFYAPASERPDWEDEDESGIKVKDKIRKEFGGNEDKWEREILARFAQAGEGVYKNALVRAAHEDYKYGDLYPVPYMIYTFGIDWNKEHGTEIVIAGTNRAPPHLSYVVYAENIPKKDFETPMGIHKVVELNRFWLPHYIYVDEGGGGSACVQMLQYFGREAAGKNRIDAKLMEIVKSYDFGSKIEIQDFQGQMVKKPAKPFMVENSVSKFETGTLKFSRSDLILQKQLDNYIVERRTPAGTPVFGLKEKKWGDHRLDALNLALIAVRLEIPSFSNEATPLSVGIRVIPTEQGVPIDKRRALLPVGTSSRGLDSAERRNNYQNTEGRVVQYWGTPPTERELQEIERKKRGQRYRVGNRTWRR